MREIIIELNDNNQRVDRFLNKYLNKAPQSLIQKYIRTKKVKVNKKRTSPDYMLKTGDIINIYVYDEVLDKYIDKKEFKNKSGIEINYIYDDENISVLYKKSGILTHPASTSDYGKTLLDAYIANLIAKGEYVPRIEKSFVPAFANRLDRNTSGMLIGCKNSNSLQNINLAIKNRTIERVYRTIVYGKIDKTILINKSLLKSDIKNRMNIDNDGIDAETIIRPIFQKSAYSLIEAELITGRTHQIRAHLSYIGHPIIGDRKYGRKDINSRFRTEYNLDNQYLIAYKLKLNGLSGDLDYLNGSVFCLDSKYYNKELEMNLFGGIYECNNK